MNDESRNPYAPPVANGDATGSAEALGHKRKFDLVSLCGWPVVLGLNLILPLLAAEGITDFEGKIGTGIAVGGCLLGGWFVCVVRPMMARKFILGAALFAFTQLFPLIHLMAGIFAMTIMGNDIDGFRGDLGGVQAFAVSMLVAAMLMPPAAFLGWLFALFLPRAWFS